MKKFKPMKVKNSSIRLPDEFLDHFLINEGDYIALIEENGKFYLRKTRDVPGDESEEEQETESTNSQVPPRTFDEIMREAQKQFSNGEMVPDDIMKSVQDALKDPDMMKKIQDMAMGLFKGFSFPPSSDNTTDDSNTTSKPKPKKTSKKDDDDDDSDDDEDSDSSFKINIE